MSAGAPRFETYQWAKGREWMLGRAPEAPIQALLLPPLFEEANFLRGFITDFSIALAGHGVGTWIADLPGTGDSLTPIEAVSWDDWRDAAAAAHARVNLLGDGPAPILAFRGGALLLDRTPPAPQWHFAPSDGALLLRMLARSEAISGLRKSPERLDLDYYSSPSAEGLGWGSEDVAQDRKVPPSNPSAEGTSAGRISELAGYRLTTGLRAALAAAAPPTNGPARIFDAPASLWRRAEPGRDLPLARAAARDAADWIATCANR